MFDFVGKYTEIHLKIVFGWTVQFISEKAGGWMACESFYGSLERCNGKILAEFLMGFCVICDITATMICSSCCLFNSLNIYVIDLFANIICILKWHQFTFQLYLDYNRFN